MWIHLVDFSPFSTKAYNFYDLFVFLHANSLLKRILSKRKEFHVENLSKFLPLRVDLFLRREAKTVLTLLPPLKVYPFPFNNIERSDTPFILRFPVKYRDFSVKSESIISLFSNSEIMTYGFSLFGTTFFLEIEFPTHSGSKTLPKGLSHSVFAWNYVKRLTFRVRTADVTYCTDVTLSLRTMSSRLSATSAFSFCWSMHYIALKFIWPHFLGTKLSFLPNIMPLNTLNKTRLLQNG